MRPLSIMALTVLGLIAVMLVDRYPPVAPLAAQQQSMSIYRLNANAKHLPVQSFDAF